MLDREEINIEAVGGSDVGRGGESAFAVAHDEEDRTLEVLRRAGYDPHQVEVATRALTNEPGQRFACIAEITESSARTGLVIKDIAVGVPDADGRIQVLAYSGAP